MANLSDFLASPAPRTQQPVGPGSNGYWRREIYNRKGTFTWTARKRGRVKVQGLGAGASGFQTVPGPSGAFGEKEFMVEAGQTLTFVIGAGGVGQSASNTRGGDGETTSISGTPIGGTPLTLVGAVSPTSTSNPGTAGTASGPWDVAYPGATLGPGGPSSGSPFGPGNRSTGRGGAGWGGPSASNAGASTHFASIDDTPTRGFLTSANGQFRDFWDLRDVDSVGSSSTGVDAGPGAGGAGAGAGTGTGGRSILGGGTGANGSGSGGTPRGVDGGFGAGGGAGGSANPVSGAGGNAIVFLFFDEVQ